LKNNHLLEFFQFHIKSLLYTIYESSKINTFIIIIIIYLHLQS